MIVGAICLTCGQDYTQEEYQEINSTGIISCGHSVASLTELIRFPSPPITRHFWNEKPEMLDADPEWGKS